MRTEQEIRAVIRAIEAEETGSNRDALTVAERRATRLALRWVLEDVSEMGAP